jgi:hypothetical protein
MRMGSQQRCQTYVAIPFGLVSKRKCFAKLRLLVPSRERDSFGLGIPISADFNVKAVGVVLRTATPDGLRRNIVAVKGY